MPMSFLSAGSGPKVRKTVGIDLGTTNSVIALLDAADSSSSPEPMNRVA